MARRGNILVIDDSSRPFSAADGREHLDYDFAWASADAFSLDEALTAYHPDAIIISPDALHRDNVNLAAIAGCGIPLLVDEFPFSDQTLTSLKLLTNRSTQHKPAGNITQDSNALEVSSSPGSGEPAQSFEDLLALYEHQSRVFDYIASTTPDFIYVFNLQGQFIYVNQRLLTVWGRSLDEAVGKTCLELGYEQWHHDMHMREIAQIIETKRPIRGEVPFHSARTGIYGVYEYIFTPVISPTGEVEAIAGTTRDVTERKEIEENLRTGKQLLENALTASGTGTFRWDPISGDFLAMDSSFRKIFGFEAGEDVKTSWDVFGRVHPDDIDGLLVAVEKVKQGEVLETEFRVLMPDGSIVWVFDRAEAVYDSSGALLQVIGACTDITKLKETEQELRAAEQHRKFIIESMPQKIFLADQNGDVIYFNRQWLEFTGMDLGEYQNWPAVIHPQHLQDTLRAWEKSIQTGEPYNLEYRLKAADGSYRWHVARAMPLRDENKQVQLWIGSCTDVDELKAVQQALEEREDRLATLNLELQKARDEALAASAAKSMFLASMSHELRTPLNAIIGYSEMLSEELTSSGQDQMAGDVNKILLSGKHLLAVISDILDISKIEAGKMEFELEAFDVYEVVQEAIMLVAPLVEKNGNELEVVRGTIGPLMVTSDRVRIRQILFNLLSNAAKFTEDGVIRVTCTSGLAAQGIYYAELSVADSGIGIPNDMIGRIFQDFSQLKGDKNRMHGGTGLGLAISRRLCQLLGGEIQVQSEEGKGSVFSVRLPTINDFTQCVVDPIHYEDQAMPG